MKYLTSLQLEQHIAALHGPISVEELVRLTSLVDFEALNGILELLPQEAKVVPSEVFLSPNVVEATSTNSRPKKILGNLPTLRVAAKAAGQQTTPSRLKRKSSPLPVLERQPW